MKNNVVIILWIFSQLVSAQQLAQNHLSNLPKFPDNGCAVTETNKNTFYQQIDRVIEAIELDIERIHKQQPPAEWADLSRDERAAKMSAALVEFWSKSEVLLRQLGQDRASSIKDFLVDQGQLADDRVYFIDATLGEAESDGRVISPLHLDSE